MVDNPRIHGVALMRDFAQLTSEWDCKEPEDIRDLLQLWHDELDGASLTRRELLTLRAAARKLRNLCSDRSGIMADYLPVGALGGLIISVAGFVAAQTARYPPFLALIFVFLGLTAFVGGVLVGTQQRRWKVPVDDLSAFEKKITERMGATTIRPDGESEEALIRDLHQFVGGSKKHLSKEPRSGGGSPGGGAAAGVTVPFEPSANDSPQDRQEHDVRRVAPIPVRVAPQPQDEENDGAEQADNEQRATQESQP